MALKQYGMLMSTAFVLIGIQAAVAAETLRPHEAVYDLTLASQSSNFSQVDGRIALQLKPDGCSGLALDYRFMARFQEEGELTVTDQQTLARETNDGKRYEFKTRTLVDGNEQTTVEGWAVNEAAATEVTFEAPVQRKTNLPLSVFPLGHTARLIEKGLAGERIVQSNLFDGDDDADKLLTTTSILIPTQPGEEADDASVRKTLSGLRAWNVTESYFNTDSDGDGMPVFETRYRLYENGVSDNLYLDFGDYTLKGGLERLTFFDKPADCSPKP